MSLVKETYIILLVQGAFTIFFAGGIMQKTLPELNPNAQEKVTNVIREELDFLIANMFENHQDFFELTGGRDREEEFDKYVSDLVAIGLRQALGNN
ncbi:hypothetical protein N9165_00330 [Akkermansiaceae bacterium]|nr:hypothetical protein [Akkermansiaceae bacterium]